MPITIHRTLTAAIAIAALGASGCAASESDPSASSSASAVSGTVTVFAAASLQATFEKIAPEFAAEHPGTTVTYSFGGSSGLLTQLGQGAPADVFASADTATMDRAEQQSLVGTTTAFATNTLTIATAPGNPKKLTSLADLARPDVSVVVCAKPVPCGAATAKVTEAANVTLSPRSEEQSVSGVLSKVRLGQADAGLVYKTDVQGAGGAVGSVDFPQSTGAVNVYPIAPLRSAKNAAGARAFIDFVTGERGRAALAEAGFGAP